MTLRRSLPLSLGLLLAVALPGVGLLGCASTPEPAPKPILRARDYYPLAVGNSWTYDVNARGQHSREEVRIVSKDAEGFYTDTRGARVIGRAEGLFDGDRFLLEEPLQVGHTWMAIPGPTEVERYETVAVGERVTVPAGSFQDCVIVAAEQQARSSTGQEAKLRIEWTWAPHVGLIRLVQSSQLAGAEWQKNVELRLTSYELVDTSAATQTRGSEGDAR